MIAEQIINKLNIAIDCIKQENFIANFPSIINHLEYIYRDLEQEKEQLSTRENFMKGQLIGEKVMEFSAELIKQYIKLKYGKDVRIETYNRHSPLTVANAGYDTNEDLIRYSTFGMLLGTKNKSSYMQTFLHECRHKIQHDSYMETRISDFLEYPPHMIIIAKDVAFEGGHLENNQEFYLNNYNQLYFEEDAEIFSLESLKYMVYEMFALYIDYAQKKNIKIDKILSTKVKYIQSLMKEHSLEIEQENKKNGKLNPIITSETYGVSPIKSTYNIDGKEVDRLIAIDKYIKNHPEIQIKMPIFKLVFNGDKPKTYSEIIEDKKRMLMYHGQSSKKIDRLYTCIIKSDPIMYLIDLIMNRDIEAITSFINEHPTVFLEYPIEIKEIIDTCYDSEIVDILNEGSKKGIKR